MAARSQPFSSRLQQRPQPFGARLQNSINNAQRMQRPQQRPQQPFQRQQRPQQPPQRPVKDSKLKPQQRKPKAQAPPRSQQKKENLPLIPKKITAVQIEGLVLLKIIKHCGEYLAQRQAVSGKLLGLPTNRQTVEITNCFPMPTTQFTESDESENDKKHQKAHQKANQYAQDMIRLMRRIREDDLGVGFYRSALNGAFLSSQTIEAQYRHQLQSSSSVCLIYDPSASIKGRLVLRAFRLTDSFMKLYDEKEFGPTSIAKHELGASDIFEELDVKIHNSHLVHAYLYEIAQLPPHKSLTRGYNRLHHSHHDGLMSNLKQLSGAIDAYAEQTQHFRSYYSKSLKNKTNREDFIAKFREQNMKLKSRGQKPRPLPEVDRMFPAQPEPDRIESVTLTAQMNEYCQEVDTSIMQALVKLWVTQGIHSENVIQ
eukprot:263088_1